MTKPEREALQSAIAKIADVQERVTIAIRRMADMQRQYDAAVVELYAACEAADNAKREVARLEAAA